MSSAKMLLIDPNRCSGCGRCELACSYSKVGKYNFVDSRIRLMRLNDFVSTIPFVCQQCTIPLCTFACPTGAISKDASTGVVSIDADLCVGCLMCFLACPLGGIAVSPTTRMPFKCDLCDGAPLCVEACEYDAIQWVDLDEANAYKRRQGFGELSKVVGLTSYSRRDQ
jgi:carbon-monoxide dehydrogenase iron sulfur subunit